MDDEIVTRHYEIRKPILCKKEGCSEIITAMVRVQKIPNDLTGYEHYVIGTVITEICTEGHEISYYERIDEG